MISGIVYTSNSGYTAQYARLLGAALDLPVTDAKWGADPGQGGHLPGLAHGRQGPGICESGQRI